MGGLMVFYKGGMTFSDLNNMPLDELFEYNEIASRLQKKMNRELKSGF